MHSRHTKLRKLIWCALIILVCATGCQSVQLQKTTVAMASHLPDIQYSQIMNNLALIADNPDALPHFALAQGSKCSVQYADQSSAGLNWDRITAAGRLLGLFRLDKENVGTTLSRLDVTEWDTTPDIDPVQELLMQGLYRKVLGEGIPSHQLAALDSFFFAKPPINEIQYNALSTTFGILKNSPNSKVKSLAQQMQSALDSYRPEYSLALNQVYISLVPGWVHVSHKKQDVPKEACYVGMHHHTYVWVMPTDIQELTNLTIAILDIANSDLSAQSGRVARGANLSKLLAPYSAPEVLNNPPKK